MQISELRRELAPLCLMAEGTLRNLQQELYGVPELRAAGLKGRAGDVGDRGLLATTSSSALLLLTAMLGKDRNTIGERVLRLWKARSMTLPGHALDRCKALGPLLTLLLTRADIRARVDFLEVNHAVPDFLVMFKDGARLFYAPYKTPAQWKRRIDAIPTLSSKSTLPAAALDKIAALIASGKAAEKNPE